MNTANRQARLRERRKADGWRRVTVWLSPEQAARLENLGGAAWLGANVKALLASDAQKTRGQPVDKTDLLAEAARLHALGVAWSEIARRWTAAGYRTDAGAEYRGPNIARDVRKLKECGDE